MNLLHPVDFRCKVVMLRSGSFLSRIHGGIREQAKEVCMFATRKLTHLFVSSIVIVTLVVTAIQSPPAVLAQGKDGLKRQANAQTGKVSFIGPEKGRSLPAAQALGLSLVTPRPADPAL